MHQTLAQRLSMFWMLWLYLCRNELDAEVVPMSDCQADARELPAAGIAQAVRSDTRVVQVTQQPADNAMRRVRSVVDTGNSGHWRRLTVPGGATVATQVERWVVKLQPHDRQAKLGRLCAPGCSARNRPHTMRQRWVILQVKRGRTQQGVSCTDFCI